MDSSSFPDLNTFPNQITPEMENKLESIDDPLPRSDLQSENNSAVPKTVESNSNSTGVDLLQTHVPTTLSRAKDSPMIYHVLPSYLVRVTQMPPKKRRCFQESVRKTRMIYNSLRVLNTFEHEKAKTLGNQKKLCADSKAATLMKDKGLWLNTHKRLVGHLPGISIGDIFLYRWEMCVLGLHGQSQAGIDYVPRVHCPVGEIATSIIVSGEYEDDDDAGDEIVYTGHGGQGNKNQQVRDQQLEHGNLAMQMSMHYGVEVRVIRKIKYDGIRTGKVYVYDGLYRIVDTWSAKGKSGFRVYKFKLVRVENQEAMGSAVMKFAASLKGKPLEVRPVGYVSNISRNEKFAVYLFNDIDNRHAPAYFNYLVTSVFPPIVYSSVGSTGCGCEGVCVEGCICYMKNGNEFPYDQCGILVKGKPLVFECGPHCHCPPCQNRVTQNGINHHFEVFRSKETSWGVRSLDLIPAGSFICEYAGEVLTREQVQLFTMNGDNLIYPSRFTERWREWGDLSKVSSDYVCPSYPSIPLLDFALDVSKMRNLACYIRHSTSPNVFVQLVLYDHNNMSFPHLMLFAMENIPPMKELSLDYDVAVADESTGNSLSLASWCC